MFVGRFQFTFKVQKPHSGNPVSRVGTVYSGNVAFPSEQECAGLEKKGGRALVRTQPPELAKGRLLEVPCQEGAWVVATLARKSLYDRYPPGSEALSVAAGVS